MLLTILRKYGENGYIQTAGANRQKYGPPTTCYCVHRGRFAPEASSCGGCAAQPTHTIPVCVVELQSIIICQHHHLPVTVTHHAQCGYCCCNQRIDRQTARPHCERSTIIHKLQLTRMHTLEVAPTTLARLFQPTAVSWIGWRASKKEKIFVHGSTHPISDHCSFIDPKRMKGWAGLVGWPVADGLPKVIAHASAAGRAQDRESSPAKDRRSTTVPRKRLVTPLNNRRYINNFIYLSI